MFALVDCNNFYASCERLFRPDLKTKPIIVLSSNDGCVVARSNEAKALGIAMGVPYFKIKSICRQHKVEVFSSNFSLYNDLSRRIMHTIEEMWPHLEIYSIDEAFLDLSSLDSTYHDVLCKDLQQTILRHTGIPTSIGIGATKTLAKLANHIAKKELKTPVFNINNQGQWLSNISVDNVWGIGSKWHKQLISHKINTVSDLADANSCYIKNQFNVMLYRTHLELKGIKCAELSGNEPQKSILSSRSFGTPQTDYNILARAIAGHCATAAEKLRRHKLTAMNLNVFICADRFKQEQYYYSIDFRMLSACDDLRYITTCAKFCLKKIYRPGILYKKAGICLSNLTPKLHAQMDLFNQPSIMVQNRAELFMGVLDKINKRFGPRTMRLAAEGFNKPWLPRESSKSPNYTTEWSELPEVYVGQNGLKYPTLFK